ncbi:run domain Beclin-1-interacting and cysteine-rich domain-containing protein-like isoform X2 [Anguilla anguilla]|uniref:run domain Beclin-1-interacting and cysteine-rich domain-containing protein-like isoform X2 n=1 Tax=Anguilla anguilla TaxID=7936 RepID=UPI0015AD3177|nr:run domain Beclin-1-interacting and cysteine-rich domain-containing protein-like isoform X2 [Anguilla anguilla]
MEIIEAEDSVRRQEHWKLLSSLKTTVEGLLSTNNPNVWSHYGGLQQLHKDMNNILSHGLKQEQVCCKQKDYWRFVWCVRYISPHLAFHVEQFSQLEPVLASGVQSSGEAYKAQRWLLHSLQEHCLSAQLRPLLCHQSHTRKYYSDEAFVLSELHVSLMLQCLEAVEQKDPGLLALVDTLRLSHLRGAALGLLKSLCLFPGAPQLSSASSVCVSDGSLSGGTNGAPWEFGGGEQETPRKSAVPQIWLTEPISPVEDTGDPGDPADRDLNDGLKYLSISNLGHRGQKSPRNTARRQHKAPPPQSLTAPPRPRSASYSEGQSGSGQSHRGHTRSVSDTGTQKHSNAAAEVCSVKQHYGPFSQNSDISTSLLSMTSEGSLSSRMSDAMFCRPLEGQSLLSYLSELDFGSCADLEKENAHFSISESLIAAIELLKCSLDEGEEDERDEEDAEDEDCDCGIQQLQPHTQMHHASLLAAFPSTDSGGSGPSSQESLHLLHLGSAEEAEQCELTGADIKHHMTCLSSRSSLSSESISSSLQSNSAQFVAMGLLRQFEGVQLPAAPDLDWLVPEHDAPQKLLPISDSMPVTPDDGERADVCTLHIRMRGNQEWAPPRPEVILNIHPAPKRKVIVARQKYLCAGCGTPTDPGYIKRLRYCEYLGRYFCQCCHENAQVVVPGRVLRKWDFTRYPVSNFARDLLSKIAADPLFNLADINSSLYKRVKRLEVVRLVRVQLFHMKNMLKTCRLAKEVLDEFDSLPDHLTEDLHLFSLNDLGAVRHGELVPQLRELLRLGSMHVAACELCQAKGFVCEFCGNDKDIIFPFELKKCPCCEGEPPLLAGGLGGMGTCSAHSWRDWKFPLPGRSARAMSQEGKGGQEEEDRKEEKEEKGIYQITKSISVGKEKAEGGSTAEEGHSQTEQRKSFFGGLAKVFSWDRRGVGEEELGLALAEAGGVNQAEMRDERQAKSQTERWNHRLGGGVTGREAESQTETAGRTTDTEQHHRIDKQKLFKVLKVGELSKVFSREKKKNKQEKEADIRGHDEVEIESVEGPAEEGGGELVDVSRLDKALFLGKNVEVEKEDCQLTTGAEEEGVTSKSVVSRESSYGKIWKGPKPIKLQKIFLKERSEREGVGSVVQMTAEEGQYGEEEGSGNVELIRGASNWRSQRTRKARRMKSSRARDVSEGKPGSREEEDGGVEEGGREGS